MGPWKGPEGPVALGSAADAHPSGPPSSLGMAHRSRSLPKSYTAFPGPAMGHLEPSANGLQTPPCAPSPAPAVAPAVQVLPEASPSGPAAAAASPLSRAGVS